LQVKLHRFAIAGGSDISISLVINGIAYTVDLEPETPLLELSIGRRGSSPAFAPAGSGIR
jgi:hypothetical protein